MNGDNDLVNAWLAQNAPRRFEAGASATPDALHQFLEKHGYDLGFTGWRRGGKATLRRIGQRGRPASLNMRELLAFVDELRIEDGLQPILKPDSDIARELGLLAA